MSESIDTTLQLLQQDCTQLERACVTDGRATPGELDVRRPGGSEFPEISVRAYAHYYGWLSRKHVGAPAPAAGDVAPDAAQALRQMLSNDPVRVTLELDRQSSEPTHPEGKVVSVFPKSPAALRWLDSLDGQCRRLAYAARQAAALETMGDDKLLALVPLGLSLAERLWVWILTHPGAFLPFDPSAQGNLEPPDWTAQCSPADYLALFAAHREVNDARIRVVNRAYGGSQDGTATIVPLDGLLAAFTKENGGRPSDVLSAWTMGEIIAQAVSQAQLQRESMARADRDRAARKH